MAQVYWDRFKIDGREKEVVEFADGWLGLDAIIYLALLNADADKIRSRLLEFTTEGGEPKQFRYLQPDGSLKTRQEL